VNVLRFLNDQLDRYAAGALSVHPFVALFAVEDARVADLRAELAGQDENTPYRGVSGLHTLRWIAVAPTKKGDEKDAAASGILLVLYIVHDGDVDDLLPLLARRAGAAVESVLRFTRQYPAADGGADGNPFIARLPDFLKKNRLPDGFFYRDLGPLEVPDADPTFVGDGTVAEIEDALEVQRSFEDFYAKHGQEEPPAALRAHFVSELARHRSPLPLTPLERAVPGEARWIRRVVEVSKRLQERMETTFTPATQHRGAHVKGHGLIKATFRVAPFAAEDAAFAVGVFATPGTQYEATIRPSNGFHRTKADEDRDTRGLAISLRLPPTSESRSASNPNERQPRQDFLLISHPSFFAPDIRQFTTLMSIFTSGSTLTQGLRAAAFVLGSGSFKPVRIVFQTIRKRLRHPLASTFYSATPYRLGERGVAKYSVEPADQGALLRFAGDASKPDFLRDALRDSLQAGPIELEFYLHVHAVDPAGDLSAIRDWVEDASLDWTKAGKGRPAARRIHAGTLRIEQGEDPTNASEMQSAEERTFNPWNALEEHRPLGSINRARWFIYRDSQKNRAAAGANVEASLKDGPPSGPAANNNAAAAE
jgi:hypothetical protein